jgi:hypothetical protein
MSLYSTGITNENYLNTIVKDQDRLINYADFLGRSFDAYYFNLDSRWRLDTDDSVSSHYTLEFSENPFGLGFIGKGISSIKNVIGIEIIRIRLPNPDDVQYYQYNTPAGNPIDPQLTDVDGHTGYQSPYYFINILPKALPVSQNNISTSVREKNLGYFGRLDFIKTNTDQPWYEAAITPTYKIFSHPLALTGFEVEIFDWEGFPIRLRDAIEVDYIERIAGPATRVHIVSTQTAPKNRHPYQVGDLVYFNSDINWDAPNSVPPGSLPADFASRYFGWYNKVININDDYSFDIQIDPNPADAIGTQYEVIVDKTKKPQPWGFFVFSHKMQNSLLVKVIVARNDINTRITDLYASPDGGESSGGIAREHTKNTTAYETPPIYDRYCQNTCNDHHCMQPQGYFPGRMDMRRRVIQEEDEKDEEF